MRLAVGAVFLLSSALAWGQEQPMASWGVQTLVTTGAGTYEGNKLRAVLVYGETGNPRIMIESIRVETGYPVASRVIWTARVDVTGGAPDPCPVAETYCASVNGLRWSDDSLVYEIIAPSTTLHCRVDKIRSRAPRTSCNPLSAGPVVADGNGSRVVHVVLVWLKEPGNSRHRTRIIEATRKFSDIPGVDEIRVGAPVASDRPTVDDSFDVGLFMIFSSKQALETYLAHPEHETAQRAILRPLARKALVYDFEDDGT